VSLRICSSVLFATVELKLLIQEILFRLVEELKGIFVCQGADSFIAFLCPTTEVTTFYLPI
jgi:hypothetical protein